MSRVVTFLMVLARRWINDDEYPIKLWTELGPIVVKDGMAFWWIRYREKFVGTVRVRQSAVVTVIDFQFATRDVVALRDLILVELANEGFSVLNGDDLKLSEWDPGPANDVLPDTLEVGGPYGTCRDLNFADVKAIVKRCNEFKSKGGRVPSFYEQLNIIPGGPRSFTLETLRGWLKDPKFAQEKSPKK